MLDCEEQQQRLPFTSYLLPPLAQCVLSFTNLPKRSRQYFTAEIEKLGGTTAPDMGKACTYLVVGDMKPSEKLRCAGRLSTNSTARERHAVFARALHARSLENMSCKFCSGHQQHILQRDGGYCSCTQCAARHKPARR